MNDYDKRSYNILRRIKVISLLNAMLIFKDSGFKGISDKLKSRKKYKRRMESEEVEETPKKKKNVYFKKLELKPNSIDIVLDYNISVDEVIEGLKDVKYEYNLFKLGKESIKKDNYYEISYEQFDEFFKSRAFVFIGDDSELRDFYYPSVMDGVEDLSKLINEYSDDLINLKLFANYNDNNNVTVRTETFLDNNGTNYYSGGAERYLVDLSEVSKKLGLNLNIYQFSLKPYFRKYEGINVIGTSIKNLPMEFNMDYLERQCDNYIGATRFSSVLHVYSAFLEAFPKYLGPSIGISHGVAWDYPTCKTENGDEFYQRNERIIKSAMNCDKMVSVDTNTANWFQTIDYKLGNQKIKVIPNYVDTNEFKPPKKKNNDKIVITYPRRLYEPRGMYLLLDIVDDLFKMYDNIEIHFVGKGFDDDVNAIKEKIKDYPDRLFCYSMTPNKMHEVYEKSDISLVPTLYSEGTSLSCLEAMSTGNIVICTRIGGLTDLILNGYNGYLIEPTKEDLLETIKNIIDNYDKQDMVRARAREVAELFNKKKWAEKWTQVIESFNIDKTSNNIDLVEFYVKDVENLSDEMFKKVKEEIFKNRLVYIRSEKPLEEDNISGGLLQVVPMDDEVYSEAKCIYVEKGIKVDRKEKIITI